MLNRPRIIPVLTIIDEDLVKTTQFKNPRYLGDPINAVKIFNEKQVDELCILDIGVTRNHSSINFSFLEKITSQAFMPLSYGGGIKTFEEVKRLFRLGFEKIVFNTSFFENPLLIKQAADYAGSSSVVLAVDVKKGMTGKYSLFTDSFSKKIKDSLDTHIKLGIEYGVGEILVNDITRDGMMNGYDLELIKQITSSVNVPVIACGGAKDINDLREALHEAGASAVAAGSLFVYYGSQKAVLINFPSESQLIENKIYT